ncbi:uncharacterized protein DSM5745_07087 [Aspergillus mulundensis]|uniref:F-box domain-containing protein n=1 Tax=Aspergillus mulundensis TaxID=1810919 RepID=A0A3D8RK54_9EURO|nr:Uncharacterized protein DSM5745_07087 [Aspergillus mulundensis]RDW74425.1 Uncharacterized protein DSM5745_07087 [Aspergillus mulundensis]
MDFEWLEDEHNVLHLMAIDIDDPRPDTDHVQREPSVELGDLREASMELGDPMRVSQSGITFFDLPENVKIKILEYASLLRPCPVEFGTEGYRFNYPNSIRSCTNTNGVRMSRSTYTEKWLSPYHEICGHPPLPVAIFRASRAAREEIATLFFARNLFSMTLLGRQDFNVFKAATRWGLKHIRHLHLNLGYPATRNLKLTGSYHRTMLKIWTDFCDKLPEKMPALRYFSLKCKVKELDVASRLMCILDPAPVLLHCAFHFADHQDDDIQRVLKRAAWRLTGNLREGPPFPFMKLPKEVQLIILEHLIVERTDPYLPSTERDLAMVGFLDRKLRPTSNSPLVCCGTCSPLGARCFCEARQTAFSTSCTCFSSPLPYFLVSRAFYEDCRRLFFSKNRFTVVEDEPECVMRFFSSIPTSSFMNIRHLSFKFPLVYRFPHKSHRYEGTSLLSWSVLRRFIREHFDLSRLSLSIVDLGTKGVTAGRNTYMRRMLKDFAELKGLRDFRVYLADDPSFEKELERAVVGRTGVGRYRPYPMSARITQENFP